MLKNNGVSFRRMSHGSSPYDVGTIDVVVEEGMAVGETNGDGRPSAPLEVTNELIAQLLEKLGYQQVADIVRAASENVYNQYLAYRERVTDTGPSSAFFRELGITGKGRTDDRRADDGRADRSFLSRVFKNPASIEGHANLDRN